MSKKVIIFTTDAGMGHVRTANLLKNRLQHDFQWNIDIVNFYQDIIPDVDIVKKITGRSSEAVHNALMQGKKIARVCLYLFLLSIRAYLHLKKGYIFKKLKQFWQAQQPDLVISVMPMTNHLIAPSLHAFNPNIPFVTIITDMAECLRNVWIVPPYQYIICGSDVLWQQAQDRGHPADRRFKVSGMLIAPAYFQTHITDKASQRKKLGLQPDLLTGIIIYGGQGSATMLELAKAIVQCEQSIAMQFIFICGHDKGTADKIQALHTQYPKCILGYVDKVAHYMAIADFFIGKPGGGCITQAIQMNLPMILEKNLFTYPQEQHNANWVKKHHLGLTIQHPKQLPNALKQFNDPIQFQQYKDNVTKIPNDSLEKIPAILQQLMN